MTATIHALRTTHRTVRLVRLDGCTFAEAGFPTSGPCDPGAPWAWIVDTICAELECSEDAVGCAESDDGDMVTVDGLPVYRVE